LKAKRYEIRGKLSEGVFEHNWGVIVFLGKIMRDQEAQIKKPQCYLRFSFFSAVAFIIRDKHSRLEQTQDAGGSALP
jgi:hypothetical protein